MPEALNNTRRRISFSPNIQKRLLQNIKETSDLTWKELGKVAGVSGRTLRDWKKSKHKMDYEVLLQLSKRFRIPLPSGGKIKEVRKIKQEAGRKGAKATYKKYGRIPVNEKARKEAWREWWEKEGQYQKHPILKRKDFTQPPFSEKLSELVGIILGDGHISSRQVSIFLHSEDDKEYGVFVSNLIKELFNVPVGVHRSSSTKCTSYVISRTDMIDYLVKELGLMKGNKIKQQVDIPTWIKESNRYSLACVRGLFDTDGCIFDHTYSVGEKEYTYKKILYTSRSRPLLESAAKTLKKEDIRVRFTKSGNDIWIDSKEMTTRYMEVIGSHNPKHLYRYRE